MGKSKVGSPANSAMGGDQANDVRDGPLQLDYGSDAAATFGCRVQPVGDVRPETNEPNI